MRTKSVLGRGLGALLKEEKNINIQEIDLKKIIPNPHQPRKIFSEDKLNELVESIKEHGIIVPVTVKKQDNDIYLLIAGERRYRASLKANLTKIPCFIRETENEEILQMALVENLQREDLNPIEIASSFKRLLDECNMRQEDIAKKVGKKRSSVTNFLRILNLPSYIQLALKENRITMGHAKALLNIDSSEKQIDLFRKILKNNLSVRKSEELAKNINEDNSQKKTKKLSNFENYTITLSKELQNRKFLDINIKAKKQESGTININFRTKTELDTIIDILYKNEK